MPNAREKARQLGLPSDILDGVSQSYPAVQREAVRASLVGNAIHIPSLMVVLIMLFQIPSFAGSLHAHPYSADEARLRDAVVNTVWQPGVLKSVPGLMCADEIVSGMQCVFSHSCFDGLPWANLRSELGQIDISSLQCFEADFLLRGLQMECGLEWSMQKSKASIMARLGAQRGLAHSRHGLPAKIHLGLGKYKHFESALGLISPFAEVVAIDQDLRFAARGIARLGPQIMKWRKVQRSVYDKVSKCLEVLDEAILQRVPSTVKCVAFRKRPALLAFNAVLLRWPDRELPVRYVLGFPVVGHIMGSGVFQDILVDPVMEEVCDTDLLGEEAELLVHHLVANARPSHSDARSEELSEIECGEGYCSKKMTHFELDAKYGRGGWRPLHRFLHVDPSGNDRLVDDPKSTGHNAGTWGDETIYTTSADFIETAVHVISEDILDTMGAANYLAERALELLPDWAKFELGAEDMLDAFRQVPILPSQCRFAITSYYCSESHGLVFREMCGCPFGFWSAVVNFCRLPALQTAVVRRLFSVAADAYFDDNAIVDLGCARGSGQSML